MEALDVFIGEGEALRCASCDIELEDRWMWLGGEVFCCRGCAAGGPCICTYEDYRPIPAAMRHPDFVRNLLRKYL